MQPLSPGNFRFAQGGKAKKKRIEENWKDMDLPSEREREMIKMGAFKSVHNEMGVSAERIDDMRPL